MSDDVEDSCKKSLHSSCNVAQLRVREILNILSRDRYGLCQWLLFSGNLENVILLIDALCCKCQRKMVWGNSWTWIILKVFSSLVDFVILCPKIHAVLVNFLVLMFHRNLTVLRAFHTYLLEVSLWIGLSASVLMERSA